ncbi:hypothetical protein Tco_1317407, partial [Tanacetum coccineum]
MANENVPPPTPTIFDDQKLPFVAWVPIGKSNFLDKDWFILDANLLREALEITPVDQAYQFVSPPSGDAIMDFVNRLGYLGEIHFVSRMAVNNLNKPKLSKAKDSTLSNHDTGKAPPNESQRNTTNHSVVVSDSLATDYDSADESSVCSTSLSLLEKLTGAEPVFGPKTMKSILKSKSTFKAETLKSIIINEHSSTPSKGNKSSSASKTNSAPAGKLKNVKIEDDPPLAIVTKELNELKLQISKNKSSYFRNKNSQQVSPNALQNKYKTQFKMNYDLCGQKIISLRIVMKPSRPAIPFPSCIHCRYNDHKSDDFVYYPICEVCGSYDHDTHGHNRIISLRRGIKPRNPQHVTKNYETCGSNVHTTSDHNDIKWFRKREGLQAKKVESFKASKTESSSALRSNTPTK